MSKQFDKLEEAFDLPDLDSVRELQVGQDEMQAALQQANELEQQFQKMDHFDQHDNEMDELAGLAIQAHKDLQELGMNVEVKHAGEIFSSSSAMLKIAVDAKNLKVEKKLKVLKLQIEKMRLDRMSGNDPNVVPGTAVTMDRNEILKQLRLMNGEDK